jgi:hypothetical protein
VACYVHLLSETLVGFVKRRCLRGRQQFVSELVRVLYLGEQAVFQFTISWAGYYETTYNNGAHIRLHQVLHFRA